MRRTTHMTSRVAAIVCFADAAVLVALPVLGFDPREFARRHGGTMRLSIATGNTGGVYYPYGGGRGGGDPSPCV